MEDIASRWKLQATPMHQEETPRRGMQVYLWSRRIAAFFRECWAILAGHRIEPKGEDCTYEDHYPLPW